MILTEEAKAAEYRQLVSGSEILESSLHLGLLEHINAEVGLGTFSNVAGAIDWLRSTFLYIRIKQNPQHYRIDGTHSNIEQTLEALCRKDIASLTEQNLMVSLSDTLRTTAYGEAMAKYYVKFPTSMGFWSSWRISDILVCHILALPQQAPQELILKAVCKAEEFSTHRFRAGDKPCYNELKKNPALRFTYAEKIDAVWQKIYLLCQIDLCAIDLAQMKEKHRDALNNISMHKASIRLQLLRLLSCMIDCRLEIADAVSVRNALNLRRSIAAKCWENHPGMLKQIPGIGDGSLRTLITAGINDLDELSKTDPRELERIFRRNPPFGNKILHDVHSLPKLSLAVEKQGVEISQAAVIIRFSVRLVCVNTPGSKRGGQPHHVIFLADTSDGLLLDFRRQSITKIIDHPSTFVLQISLVAYTERIRFTALCEEIGNGINLDVVH